MTMIEVLARNARANRELMVRAFAAASEQRRTSGGIAGRTYPGNFDWEKLKKRQGKIDQLATKMPIAPERSRSWNACFSSWKVRGRRGVQGRSASKTTGK